VADEQQHRTADRLDSPPDTGLKRLLIYTFIALVLAVLAALVAVNLVTRWFDTG
jgi:hypothetical protein